MLLYTTDASGNKTSQNVVEPQGNVITAMRYDNRQYAYFYNKDIRTSVTNIVDESGAGIVSYRYDEVTEQYYLNARYYDSENLTFLTQDSYRGEQDDYGTWNLYAYCGGNPVTYVDPSGHDALAAPLYTYGAANAWNPSGWIALGAAGIITIGSIVYLGGKAYEVYKVRNVSQTKAKVKVKVKAVAKIKINSAVRSKHRIARRRKYNSRKRAYEAAKRAGKGREPIHHKRPGERPHYHPNVNNPYSKTPKQPNFHDHYFYPR